MTKSIIRQRIRMKQAELNIILAHLEKEGKIMNRIDPVPLPKQLSYKRVRVKISMHLVRIRGPLEPLFALIEDLDTGDVPRKVRIYGYLHS